MILLFTEQNCTEQSIEINLKNGQVAKLQKGVISRRESERLFDLN